MLAIHTKYINPTNSSGSKIKAYTVGYGDIKGFSVSIPYPHKYSHELCHFQAVKALIKKYKLDWKIKDMRYGDSSDGKGYSFCFNESKVEE